MVRPKAPARPESPESLFDVLKAMIIDEGLAPGDRLPTEAQLAERFGVSRHKLREQLRGLTMMGILEATPRRGTIVRAYDADLWARNLAFHGKVTGYELADAQEARIAMELSVVPLVVRNAGSSEWLQFESLLSTMKMALEERALADFGRADREFHELLVVATHNPLLQMLRPMIRWIFGEALRSFPQTLASCNNSFEEHQAIVKAMRNGDVARAQRILESHLKVGLKSIKATVRSKSRRVSHTA